MPAEIKPELYIPSVPMFPKDLASRNEFLDVARESGIKTSGLMLVVLKPEHVLDPQNVQKQLDNLDPFVKKTDGERPAMFVMHSWKPLTGTADPALNFLTHRAFSQDYVEAAIEFASKIPDELSPPSGRALSFHLSAYITPGQWKRDPEFWKREWEPIRKTLKDITEFGKRKGVNVHIENVPVVPWGDWAKGDDSKIPGTNYHFRDLGTPWPGLPWRPEMEAIRKTGAHWTIDVCHMHTAMRNVKEVARLAQKGLREKSMNTYMVFESDLDVVHRAMRNFSNEVLGVVKKGDIVHLNQTTGKFTRQDLQGKDSPYGDSASLTNKKGNIPAHHLEAITEGLLRSKGIKVVIEVNEPIGKMEEALNTRASLEYVLRIAQRL